MNLMFFWINLIKSKNHNKVITVNKCESDHESDLFIYFKSDTIENYSVRSERKKKKEKHF